MSIHVSNLPLAGSIESTIRQAETAGLIVDANLTSATAAKAAIDTAAGKINVSQRTLAIGAKKAVDLADTYVSGWSAGEDVSDLYDGVTGTWQAGFAVNC